MAEAVDLAAGRCSFEILGEAVVPLLETAEAP